MLERFRGTVPRVAELLGAAEKGLTSPSIAAHGVNQRQAIIPLPDGAIFCRRRMNEAEFNECLERLARGRYPSLAEIAALKRFMDAHPDRRSDHERAVEAAGEREAGSEPEAVKEGHAAAPLPPSLQATSDDDALGPLQKWPDNVSPELWRSRRSLMGDPDRGMQTSAHLQTRYQDGLRFMRIDDPVAAGEAFTEAAQGGHAGAIREIAVAAFDDLPGEIIWGVVPLFKRAAAAGDGRAMAYLGIFCRLKENNEGALKHYRASDQWGDPEGSRELGILLARMGRTDEALVAMERARTRGSASGAVAQGILLGETLGDRDGAREAFLAAAEMGHPKGSLYLIDLLVSEGEHEAAERERNRASQNLSKHRALMELLEGEGSVERAKAQVASGGALTSSGSSCALLTLPALIAVLGLACVQFG